MPGDVPIAQDRPVHGRVVGENPRPLTLEGGAVGRVGDHERRHPVRLRIELLLEEQLDVPGDDLAQGNLA
jgi:hypothetical protein